MSKCLDTEMSIASIMETEKNGSPITNTESYKENAINLYVKKSETTFTEEEQFSSSGNTKTNWVDKIGHFLNAETRGIEKVEPEDKFDHSYLNPFTIFFTPQLAVSALSTGSVGIGMGLSFTSTVVVIVLFSIIGSIPVGLFCLFGMKFGLRQQIMSRHLTGNIMGRVFAFFNVVSCIGWNAINVIPCAQLLNSVNHNFKPWIGCLILVLCTCILAVFGYKAVHLYERYAWIPTFVVYIVIIARFTIIRGFEWGHEKQSAQTEAGNILSFIVVMFGFTAGWSPSASDFLVYFDNRAKSWKVAMAMILGLVIPAIGSCVLGAALATSTNKPGRFKDAYDSNSFGGLIYEILCGDNHNQGYRFLIVVLALSAVQNNLSGGYCLSLAIQCVWSRLAKIPRIAWCILGNLVCLGFAIPAYYVFFEAMSNFLSIISYNVSIYIGISLAEHFIYRKDFEHYDISNFNDRKTFPVGIAGVVGFAFGVCSTVLAMNQTWYQGVIARKIGDNGGDISFELNIIFSFIGYNLVRPFEKKYFAR
ncbi:hypothetical protein KGF56_001616 [Candida oxycetoniae]|uniref:Purine-cytosine permease n=1 Tax=Candida oxycetoniae TaxID=497107 RepID=A0AAI9SYR3_9ASCO|nr:uncharacterized protein KGF56_001616 [Candida oxycetoniae]KAI3405598.2 hypothetical protein KGF56_001616 [Candida oxycetoniae]